MPAEHFLDTNIFVYDLTGSAGTKQRIASDLIGDALDSGRGCISYQVVNECINVSLRIAETPLAEPDVRRYLDRVLLPLMSVQPTASLYQDALDVRARYQLQFYDALIVAGAFAAGCHTLYSEDMQHGQRIRGLTIVNPFL